MDSSAATVYAVVRYGPGDDLLHVLVGPENGWRPRPVDQRFDPSRWWFIYHEPAEVMDQLAMVLSRPECPALDSLSADRGKDPGAGVLLSRVVDIIVQGTAALRHSDVVAAAVRAHAAVAPSDDDLGLRGLVRGRVTSATRDKTVTAVVERRRRHDKYGKLVSRRTKYHVHDEYNIALEGDTVEFIECAPISKQKHHRLVRVVRSRVGTKPDWSVRMFGARDRVMA